MDYPGFVAEFDKTITDDDSPKKKIEEVVERLRSKYEVSVKIGAGRTIVTMTSYQKRIGNCERVI